MVGTQLTKQQNQKHETRTTGLGTSNHHKNEKSLNVMQLKEKTVDLQIAMMNAQVIH